MKIGLGKAVITPPVGFSLTGYFNDRRSTGIRDELYVISCVIEDKGKTFAIASVDLCWVGEETVKKAKKIVYRETGIPHFNVLIHATHTHTGPLPDSSGGDVYKRGFYVEPAYIELLPLYIAGSIKMAYNQMTDVSIGVGKDKVEGIAFNRRYLLKDGRVITNPWDRVGDIVEVAGPVDDTLCVVKITDKKSGKVKGIVVNFALHPDTLGDTFISADWPGMVREKIKDAYPDAEVMVLNGPSGDINHINPEDPGRRGVEVPLSIAEKIKEKTLSVLERMDTIKDLSLSTYYKKFSVPVRKVSPDELKKAKGILKSKKLPPDSLQYMVSSALVEIAEEKGKKVSLEISGCSFGKEAIIIGLPGEIFTGLGMKIKELLPFGYKLIAQNSNTNLGYVPSEEAFQQDEKNREIMPCYGTQSLVEAIGIDCSYETSPLACSVDSRAERAFLSAIRSIIEK
ncbi:MAG: neutral/alkaline non-lysosomal ceramidase N-terminal domain-containing protein [Candidatus Ratteibacteria bacterium]|nr:neutral/alkaline non-lysosomal ceramidase N-terminal domain-containing protein [Candidatus Ratteibacteria bacterium]